MGGWPLGKMMLYGEKKIKKRGREKGESFMKNGLYYNMPQNCIFLGYKLLKNYLSSSIYERR